MKMKIFASIVFFKETKFDVIFSSILRTENCTDIVILKSNDLVTLIGEICVSNYPEGKIFVSTNPCW